jgi:uncharacterized phage-associated protein
MEQVQINTGETNDIKFAFSYTKLRDVLSFLASKVGPLDSLKAAKLIYFADRMHLLKYGTPITGDYYVHREHGPIPSKSLDLIRDFLCQDGDRNYAPKEELSRLAKRFDIGRVGKYPALIIKKEYAPQSLSPSEIEALTGTVTTLGKYSGWYLRTLSHEHGTWKDTKEGQIIDFRLFFAEVHGEADEAFDLMLATQEDRDFVAFIND